MMIIPPSINTFTTLLEGGFSFIGYLPQKHFPKLCSHGAEGRYYLGLIQTVSGLGLATIGFIMDTYKKESNSHDLPFSAKILYYGIAHINHGLFNLIRSYIEKQGFNNLTLAYDFFGKKVIPPLSPNYDLTNHVFEPTRDLLSSIHFVSLFPPKIEFSHPS